MYFFLLIPKPKLIASSIFKPFGTASALCITHYLVSHFSFLLKVFSILLFLDLASKGFSMLSAHLVEFFSFLILSTKQLF